MNKCKECGVEYHDAHVTYDGHTIPMKGAAMSELPKYLRKCTKCGMTDFKECMWATDYGGYLCDKCYMNAKPQPQLTIPKNIAEIVDKYTDKFGIIQIEKDDALELTVAIDNPVDRLESGLIYDFADKNPELLAAYLNPLTRYLVKVVGV